MKKKTFPFYTLGTSLNCPTISALQEIFVEIFDENSPVYDSEWPFDRHYEAPLNAILSLYIKIVTTGLGSAAPGEPLDIVNRTLRRIDHLEIPGARDLTDTFNAVKDSLLKGQNIDRLAVIDLLNMLTEKTENYVGNNILLLKGYGTDLSTIQKYFSNIHNIEENADVKYCFHSIGVTGMRHLIYNLIEENNFSIHQISKLRKYSELFCLYVNFLNDLPRINDNNSTLLTILTLMKAAYREGAAAREEDFYSKSSLETMYSFGTSHGRTVSFEPQQIFYDQALAIADAMWKDNCEYFHNKMADYLMELDQFKGKLKKYKLLKMLKTLAQGYDRVRGVKRQKKTLKTTTRLIPCTFLQELP